jgi:hypothetical protein
VESAPPAAQPPSWARPTAAFQVGRWAVVMVDCERGGRVPVVEVRRRRAGVVGVVAAVFPVLPWVKILIVHGSRKYSMEGITFL